MLFRSRAVARSRRLRRVPRRRAVVRSRCLLVAPGPPVLLLGDPVSVRVQVVPGAGLVRVPVDREVRVRVASEVRVRVVLGAGLVCVPAVPAAARVDRVVRAAAADPVVVGRDRAVGVVPRVREVGVDVGGRRSSSPR